MGCCLVHVEVGREHPKLRIALLKSKIILIQNSFRKLSVLTFSTHVFLIANLQNEFMEWFFLLAGTDFLIVIFYLSVLSRLLLVVPLEGFHGRPF